MLLSCLCVRPPFVIDPFGVSPFTANPFTTNPFIPTPVTVNQKVLRKLSTLPLLSSLQCDILMPFLLQQFLLFLFTGVGGMGEATK